MNLYLVLNMGLNDTCAATALLKEFYLVECRGMFGNAGIVYACDKQIDPSHMETLSIIDFI